MNTTPTTTTTPPISVPVRTPLTLSNGKVMYTGDHSCEAYPGVGNHPNPGVLTCTVVDGPDGKRNCTHDFQFDQKNLDTYSVHVEIN
jgi:hypothetical protein